MYCFCLQKVLFLGIFFSDPSECCLQKTAKSLGSKTSSVIRLGESEAHNSATDRQSSSMGRTHGHGRRILEDQSADNGVHIQPLEYIDVDDDYVVDDDEYREVDELVLGVVNTTSKADKNSTNTSNVNSTVQRQKRAEDRRKSREKAAVIPLPVVDKASKQESHLEYIDVDDD